VIDTITHTHKTQFSLEAELKSCQPSNMFIIVNQGKKNNNNN